MRKQKNFTAQKRREVKLLLERFEEEEMSLADETQEEVQTPDDPDDPPPAAPAAAAIRLLFIRPTKAA